MSEHLAGPSLFLFRPREACGRVMQLRGGHFAPRRIEPPWLYQGTIRVSRATRSIHLFLLHQVTKKVKIVTTKTVCQVSLGSDGLPLHLLPKLKN